MDINGVLKYLEIRDGISEVSETEMAHIKTFTLEFLRKVPDEQYEYRWRILTALYFASMRCASIHEVYLVNELTVIEKTFAGLEHSVLKNLHEGDGHDKRVLELQLSYTYRMFDFYLQRMKTLARVRGYKMLYEKLDKEHHRMNERSLEHSHKFSGTVSLYQILLEKKFKKHYYFYAHFSGIGIVAFWHGFWGIFDILGFHPFATAIMGTWILLLTGIFFKEFLHIKK